MTTRTAIVAEALTWKETLFHHQAHTRGLATDCIGMIAGVGIAVGAFAPDSWEREFARYAGYARSPANGVLEKVCRRYLREVAEPQAGDVALMRFDQEPQHLAIFVPYRHGGLALVHALARAGKVVEHRYSAPWPSMTVATFAYPGVEDSGPASLNSVVVGITGAVIGFYAGGNVACSPLIGSAVGGPFVPGEIA